MEKHFEDWLVFSTQVEEKLKSVNTDIFSEKYRQDLKCLLEEIKNEVHLFPSLSPLQKQESFLKVNDLGNDLRLAAYFVD